MEAEAEARTGRNVQNLECVEKQALRKKLTGRPVHAAFSKATNSVLVAAKRCAFSSR